MLNRSSAQRIQRDKLSTKKGLYSSSRFLIKVSSGKKEKQNELNVSINLTQQWAGVSRT